MRILNAMSGTINIPMDNESIIVLPGKVCDKALTATQDLVQKVMSIGNNDQIGLIIEGPYDLQIVERVPGASEYCFSTVEQATKKLIDPDKDYNEIIVKDVETMKLRATIADLEKNLKKKTKELEKAKADYQEELNKRTSELESVKIINAKEEEINSLKTRLSIIDNQSKETRDSLAELEKENTEYKKTIGDNDQLIKSLTAKNSKLTEDNKRLKESLEKLIAEVEKSKSEPKSEEGK